MRIIRFSGFGAGRTGYQTGVTVIDLELAAWEAAGPDSQLALAAAIVSDQSGCSRDAACFLMEQRARLTGMHLGQIADDVVAGHARFGPVALALD